MSVMLFFIPSFKTHIFQNDFNEIKTKFVRIFKVPFKPVERWNVLILFICALMVFTLEI